MYNKALLSHRLRRRIKDASHAPTCEWVAHHWLVEEPERSIRGSYPLGRCKFCGAVARFSNTVRTSAWVSKPKAAKAKEDAVAALAVS